ncbi:uncharacterized protein [Nicotiana tomentosiformis]|uniref:uncharacterized protein n=1 Tax=Nicotiana tomentosiformis TaxID=4098 RepID=UPI00388C9EDD
MAYVRDVSIDIPTVELVTVVRDFPDVFPADLPGSGSYTVYCDASRIGLGAVMMQDDRVIASSSRRLKRRWLELLKDYDNTILYDLGKANVVADALSRKEESLGSLAYLAVTKRPLALDVQALANQFVRLDISEPSRVLSCVVFQSSLYDRIREREYDDPPSTCP